MSVGVEVNSKPTGMNLTQLCRNTRSKKEKRSGRKQPCDNDLDTTAGNQENHGDQENGRDQEKGENGGDQDKGGKGRDQEKG